MLNRFPYVFLLMCLVVLPSVAEEETAKRILNDGNLVIEGIPEIPERLPAQLNRYQNVRSAFVQDWTEDGNGLYVLTRFGDVSQLHLVSMPGGARRQLTFLSEPIANVRRQPTGTSLRFSMDEGGSEFYQLFVLDPDSGDSRRLTDGSSRNLVPKWSRDGKLMAYQSTRRDGRSNDIWLMEVDEPETAHLILEAPDGSWWAPSDWDPDGYYRLHDWPFDIPPVTYGQAPASLLRGVGEVQLVVPEWADQPGPIIAYGGQFHGSIWAPQSNVGMYANQRGIWDDRHYYQRYRNRWDNLNPTKVVANAIFFFDLHWCTSFSTCLPQFSFPPGPALPSPQASTSTDEEGKPKKPPLLMWTN